MDQEIASFIETTVNPLLKIHAAHCEFVVFEEGILKIKLFGGCSGCPTSNLALFQQIKPLLEAAFPLLEDIHLQHGHNTNKSSQ